MSFKCLLLTDQEEKKNQSMQYFCYKLFIKNKTDNVTVAVHVRYVTLNLRAITFFSLKEL